MEFPFVKKICIIVAFIFVIMSILELLFSIILAFSTINLGGSPILISSLLLEFNYMPLEGLFLWVFLNVIIVFFLISGLILLRYVKKKEADDITMAKSLVIFGMMFLIVTFIKLEYIFLLNGTEVNGNYTFQEILYNPEITASYIPVLWIFYTAISCGYLIMGLVVPAISLYWVLQLEKSEENNEEKEK